jgi:hypothetical protein
MKIKLQTYYVYFDTEGHEGLMRVNARSPAEAFKKCLKRHPDVRLKSAVANRDLGSGRLHMEWDAPSQTKVEPTMTEYYVQTEMELDLEKH